MHQLNKHVDPKKDYVGIFLHHSICGKKITETHHKTLISEHDICKMGIEFSDCALSERNHFYNQRIPESKRDNFPKFGHYDSWMVDSLQMIVL